MDLLHSIAHFAGRMMKPLRAGERRLAGQRLAVTAARKVTVDSPAFGDGARIPDAHAGADGRSPPMRFGAAPPTTNELVLLCEDPDAPLPRPFVHWIVVGIPPDLGELPEGLPPSAAPLSSGVQQGRNTLRQDGYTGPAPPPGHGVHRYHFQLFALDRRLEARAPIDRERLVDAMRGHVVGFGEWVGTYERS